MSWRNWHERGGSRPPSRRRPASQQPRRAVALLWIVLPLAVLGLAIWWLIAADPLRSFDNGAPPVENLTFERTILHAGGIDVLVRAGGSEPMTIAQVQVDDAYWQFTQDPAGTDRARRKRLDPPAVPLGSGRGACRQHRHEHRRHVRARNPCRCRHPDARTGRSLTAQALLGVFVGIVPVAIGLMFYPALRGVGRNGMNFLLALTVGLLAFLFVDALEDALELAGEAAALFQGPTMVVLAAVGSFLLLMAVGRRAGAPTGLALATYIALGIGLHNLGEGLAIGAAFAAGAAGLGTFLVLGFTLHNITEGIGIAAPILKERPPLGSFVGLTLLAGGPAVVGLWIGSLAFAPQWSALALAIGAGAILQVIVEVTLLLRSGRTIGRAVLAGRDCRPRCGVGSCI